jgi:hypothetical protein
VRSVALVLGVEYVATSGGHHANQIRRRFWKQYQHNSVFLSVVATCKVFGQAWDQCRDEASRIVPLPIRQNAARNLRHDHSCIKPVAVSTHPDRAARAIPDEHMPVLRFVPPVIDRRSQEQQHRRLCWTHEPTRERPRCRNLIQACQLSWLGHGGLNAQDSPGTTSSNLLPERLFLRHRALCLFCVELKFMR